MDTVINKKIAFTPIIGIGGSAGSLEALEIFFHNTTPDSGMAYIVITHLDPKEKCLLPDILQNYTRMEIGFAIDGATIEPNKVYIKPPEKEISIFHGKFRLFDLPPASGLKLPIDAFFTELAEDQNEKCAGVILSGTGTDGTHGIKAIKDKLGTVFVQDVRQAKFNGMPQSAIDTGFADYILPVEEIPERLLHYFKNYTILIDNKIPDSEKNKSNIEKIFILIRNQTGQDFSLYKKTTIYRRIERRMNLNLIKSISDYILYLKENAVEIDLLYKELLIGVTEFFRDPQAFEVLRQDILPKIFEGKEKNSFIRIWIVGCSTGEEVYSVAITCKEYQKNLRQNEINKIQIFASDINGNAIESARRGLFPLNIINHISGDRINGYFIKEDDKYRIKKEIREMVVFSKQNIIQDPPLTKIDLIVCRNLLIYLTAELQVRLLSLFHYSLNSNGILFLGNSESIGSKDEFFSVLNSKWKFFKRREVMAKFSNFTKLNYPVLNVDFEREKVDLNSIKTPELNVAGIIQKILLENFTPAAVLINELGDIIFFHGKTGNYLEPPSGKINMNIFAMARDDLKYELGHAVKNAIRDKKDIIINNIEIKVFKKNINLHLIVKQLSAISGMNKLFLIIFNEFEPPATLDKGKAHLKKFSESKVIKDLENELKAVKESLQITNEEMISSQEEQKSTNEELQSINEELQSTNEELSTSKEEMQSLNEELMSVNSELQTKIAELTDANNDLRNFLNNTEIGTIFLDNDLVIKRFNNAITKIINLIKTDLGRPLSDIVTNLKIDNLLSEAREVLETLVFKQMQVQTKDNVWYQIRITPYRTIDNVIDGLVITFNDISDLKQMETSLEESRNLALAIIDTIKEPLIILDENLKVISAAKSFYATFLGKQEETENKYIYEIGGGQWNLPELIRKLHEVLSQNSFFENLTVIHDFQKIGLKKMKLGAKLIIQKNKSNKLILLAIEDITEDIPGG